jgi:hypothetical protein
MIYRAQSAYCCGVSVIQLDRSLKMPPSGLNLILGE